MLLAIDAGNTRVKWGVLSAAGELKATGVCFHDAIADLQFDRQSEITNIAISNVAGEQVGAALSALLDQLFGKNYITIEWVSSTISCGTLNNGYDAPETLGTDRWAAMVGAWQQIKQSCVVVNMGTTITIDLIEAAQDKAHFVGGTIMPGLFTMAKSLHANTAQLPHISTNATTDNELVKASKTHHAFSNVGLNTADAISKGITNAVIGAIHQATTALYKTGQTKPTLIITGGDAISISEQLIQLNAENSVIKQIHVDENLVLLGLFHLCHAS